MRRILLALLLPSTGAIAATLKVFILAGHSNLEGKAKTVGSDYPFHYLGSTFTYSDIEKALGEAMIALQQGTSE